MAHESQTQRLRSFQRLYRGFLQTPCRRGSLDAPDLCDATVLECPKVTEAHPYRYNSLHEILSETTKDPAWFKRQYNSITIQRRTEYTQTSNMADLSPIQDPLTASMVMTMVQRLFSHAAGTAVVGSTFAVCYFVNHGLLWILLSTYTKTERVLHAGTSDVSFFAMLSTIVPLLFYVALARADPNATAITEQSYCSFQLIISSELAGFWMGIILVKETWTRATICDWSAVRATIKTSWRYIWYAEIAATDAERSELISIDDFDSSTWPASSDSEWSEQT